MSRSDGINERPAMLMRSVPIILAAAFVVLPADAADKHFRVKPGLDAQEDLQEALIEIAPGGTVELAPGIYELTDGLSLDVPNVTVRGAGKYRTVLSFKDQEAGSEGLLVTSDGVRLEGFAVEDTRGDGIKVKDVDGIAMIGLRAEWTRGPHSENGAYGLYPVGSKNVLIDGCVAVAASDAGIYVGQSENIVIRNSTARDNVAGFEVENSYYADVYDNTAANNTGGFLIFDLPNLPQQGGHHVRLFRNISVDNNTPNFAPPGNIVASVPQGLGIMIMANRDVEVFENYIAGNQSVGVSIISYPQEFDDEIYDPHPRAVHVRDNRFGRNGWDPKGAQAEQASAIAGGPLPAIMWDGVMPLAYGGEPVPPEDWIYITGNGEADFINLNMAAIIAAQMAGEENPVPQPLRDLAPHDISLDSLPPVELELD